MKARMIKIAVVGWILTLGSTAVQATPVLLGEYDGSAVGNIYPYSGQPTGVVYVLGYSPPSLWECPGYIGCEREWALGETGSFDFDSGNALDFGAAASLLTDGVTQDVSAGAWTINDGSSSVVPGVIQINPDSYVGLAAGDTIDFIRLVVSATDLTVNAGTAEYNYVATWQFWGTPVPEPSTAVLFGIGLAGMGLARRSRRV